ncbi:MAG: hypothetical protein QS748_13150 [Candidatus Endonucleobacter bathymodioli]|uniref:Uncharacterized protein n=1 Tax=Candidatus Endonucleibacter bathymodioli TaxID=539814 RepID=A0AA90NNX6_9GAMM|nr:hypothetical protein [Candidatus Endonucleobacter bathymodioli]
MKLIIISMFFYVFTINCLANSAQNTKPDHVNVSFTNNPHHQQYYQGTSNVINTLHSTIPRVRSKYYKEEKVSQTKKTESIVRNYHVDIF